MFILWVVLIALLIVGFPVGLFLFTYFVLAKKGIFFTLLKEGTAKIILHGKEFHDIFIQWQGKTIDRNWNIIPGEDHRRRLIGGLRWIGFWPAYSIDKYKFKWTGVKEDGTFDPHPAEMLDEIILKDDVYGLRIVGAEDNDKVPLDIDITLTVQIVNPYKARFTVQNWFETLVNRLAPYVRDYITNHTYDWMIKTDVRLDKEIVTKLAAEGIIGPIDNLEQGGEFLARYGVLVRKLEVRDINPQEKYREATLRQWTAAREAEARGKEATGALIQMISEATGKSSKEIQEEISKSRRLKKRFIDISVDFNTRQMAIKGNSFFDLRYQGPDGIGAVLSAIAGFKKIPGIGQGNRQNSGQGDGVQPSPPTESATDWFDKEYAELMATLDQEQEEEEEEEEKKKEEKK